MTTTCTVEACDIPVAPKGARGMCSRHYQYWRLNGSPVKPCPTCDRPLQTALAKYCSEACKPRCSVQGCDGSVRKRDWCASHYAQAKVSGRDPEPFKFKWNDLIPCLNCGAVVDKPMHRRFCTDNCRVAYKSYDGPRPSATNCVACGISIDLNKLGKGGTRRQTTTRLCRPCRNDRKKYGMSAWELAQRDGTNCGICALPVDMAFTRANGGDCPSVDHIVPRARGGSHEPTNLQLAHLRCNMLKSDHVLAESGC